MMDDSHHEVWNSWPWFPDLQYLNVVKAEQSHRQRIVQSKEHYWKRVEVRLLQMRTWQYMRIQTV